MPLQLTSPHRWRFLKTTSSYFSFFTSCQLTASVHGPDGTGVTLSLSGIDRLSSLTPSIPSATSASRKTGSSIGLKIEGCPDQPIRGLQWGSQGCVCRRSEGECVCVSFAESLGRSSDCKHIKSNNIMMHARASHRLYWLLIIWFSLQHTRCCTLVESQPSCQKMTSSTPFLCSLWHHLPPLMPATTGREWSPAPTPNSSDKTLAR